MNALVRDQQQDQEEHAISQGCNVYGCTSREDMIAAYFLHTRTKSIADEDVLLLFLLLLFLLLLLLLLRPTYTEYTFYADADGLFLLLTIVVRSYSK